MKSPLRILLPFFYLIAVLALFVADCRLLDSASLAFVRSTVPPDTISDLPEPRFFTSPDSYVWLCHTRDMLLAGDWRIRHTHMDNAPYGRPMHWSHLLIWELAAHARLLRHLHPGLYLSPAIEIAGRCAMPLFGILFIIPLYFAFFRKLGFVPAALFATILALHPLFTPTFSPLDPDHHLFQTLFTLAVVAALTFGGWGRVAGEVVSGRARTPCSSASFWFRPLDLPSPDAARRWFLLAGAAHACLLWIGASVWLVVHCALCLAALSALGHPAPGSRHEPRLWLCFLATSLPLAAAFYLLEYAPRFPGMRLEVNHPLYWLFLVGSLLTLLSLSSTFCSPGKTSPLTSARVPPVPLPEGGGAQRRGKSPHRPLPYLLLGLLLASLLPLAILFGPSSWYSLHDPFLKRLHARCIVEFQSWVPIVLKSPRTLLSFFRVFLLPLCITPILAFLPLPHPSPGIRRIFRPHAVLLLIFLALSFFQARWSSLLVAVLVLPTLLLVGIPLAGQCPDGHATMRPCSRRLAAAFLVLLALDTAWGAASRIRTNFQALRVQAPVGDWMRCDLIKRTALRLAAASSGRALVLAGDPSDAPVFYYFGGIPSLASYYWENAAGWHVEAPLLAAPADAIPPGILAEARARGLTHVIVAPDSQNPEIAHYVATGRIDPAYSHRFALHGVLARHADPSHPAPVPSPFVLDTPLTAALSRTNLYLALRVGADTVFPNHLSWSAFSLPEAPPPSPSPSPSPPQPPSPRGVAPSGRQGETPPNP